MAGPVASFKDPDGRVVMTFASNVELGSVFLAINGPGSDGNGSTECARLEPADAIALGVALIRAAGLET